MLQVVYAYAKILILKQITTYLEILTLIGCCICLCKDTNFKANHNSFVDKLTAGEVVYAYAKILILKQITTGIVKLTQSNVLYMPMQRY